MTEPRKKLRLAMIGCGFMGKAHSNAWRQATHFFPLKADVELDTICGCRGEGKVIVPQAVARWGFNRGSTNWHAVVASPEIDVVDIVAPNHVHAQIAIAAAKAGKHILCEKPLAMNSKQCAEMVKAVKKAGVIHMVNQNYRRVPAISLAKKMIENGSIGTIYHFRARYAQDWITDPNFPLVWRLRKEVSGSGAHGDLNAHIIDLSRFLIGEYKEVCGMMHTFIKRRPLEDKGAKREGLGGTASRKMGTVTVDDTALFIGRFENGAIASLEATRFALGRKNHITIEINGSKGSLYFDLEDMNRLQFFDNSDAPDRQGFRDILVTQPGEIHPYVGKWWPPGHIIGYEHSFVHAVADFVNAIVDGKPVAPTFEDGLRNEQVLEAVERSAKTRQWVKV